MSDRLDVIIVDDESIVCQLVSKIISTFYTWGDILTFTYVDEAILYCLNHYIGVAIFIVNVFLEGKSGFYFLDAIEKSFPTAHENTIVITGNASHDVVDMCVASGVRYLLEKPIKTYALSLAVRSIASKYMKFAKKLL